MSIAYDDLLASDCWDKRFDLPSFPWHLNPHLYTAYAVRVLESLDDEKPLNASGAMTLRSHYGKVFLPQCEVIPGILVKYPGSEKSSGDDAHGGAFLNPGYAMRCMDCLSSPVQNSPLDRVELFIPPIEACAHIRLGAVAKTQYILALLNNLIFQQKGSKEPHLLLWLTFPIMREQKGLARFIRFWENTQIKRGLTPRAIFKKYELMDCDWFSVWAREDWK